MYEVLPPEALAAYEASRKLTSSVVVSDLRTHEEIVRDARKAERERDGQILDGLKGDVPKRKTTKTRTITDLSVGDGKYPL